jgi:hypothetical protein
MVEKSEKCKLNYSGILVRKPNFSRKEVFKFQCSFYLVLN